MEETKYFINDSEPKFIFCNINRAKEIQKLKLKEDTSIYEMDPINGFLKFNIDEYKELEDIQTVNSDEIISFLYTSGTTGKSKAVALSHNNLYSNANSLKEYWHIQKSDRLIHMLPIFHTHGLFVAINTAFLSGLSLYFFEKFSLSDLVEVLPNSTLLMGVPNTIKE